MDKYLVILNILKDKYSEINKRENNKMIEFLQ